MQLNEVLQLLFLMIQILKLLNDSFIINTTNYMVFNVHNQAIIYPLIFHSILQFILLYFIAKKLISSVAIAIGIL